MRFEPTAIAGAFIVAMEPQADDRGSFARSFCEGEFAAAGIDFRVVQLNLSRNPRARTLRGMHGQRPPHEEAKLIQCVRGRIFDVAVDLRRGSSTYLAHAGVDLDAGGERLFYVPPGCLHGFLTLNDDSDVLYHMGSAFVPGAGFGLRWNDPALGIAWPTVPTVLSERDAAYPDFAG